MEILLEDYVEQSTYGLKYLVVSARQKAYNEFFFSLFTLLQMFPSSTTSCLRCIENYLGRQLKRVFLYFTNLTFFMVSLTQGHGDLLPRSLIATSCSLEVL